MLVWLLVFIPREQPNMKLAIAVMTIAARVMNIGFLLLIVFFLLNGFGPKSGASALRSSLDLCVP